MSILNATGAGYYELIGDQKIHFSPLTIADVGLLIARYAATTKSQLVSSMNEAQVDARTRAELLTNFAAQSERTDRLALYAFTPEGATDIVATSIKKDNPDFADKVKTLDADFVVRNALLLVGYELDDKKKG